MRKRTRVRPPPAEESGLADEEKYTYQESFELEPSKD
jgi:hypothetical protein